MFMCLCMRAPSPYLLPPFSLSPPLSAMLIMRARKCYGNRGYFEDLMSPSGIASSTFHCFGWLLFTTVCAWISELLISLSTFLLLCLGFRLSVPRLFVCFFVQLSNFRFQFGQLNFGFQFSVPDFFIKFPFLISNFIFFSFFFLVNASFSFFIYWNFTLHLCKFQLLIFFIFFFLRFHHLPLFNSQNCT